jgi:hypothetical protein
VIDEAAIGARFLAVASLFDERSRAAILALGAQFEGVFRKHMRMADGRIRDSAWYAITDDGWPAVRARLVARLAARARSEAR